MVLDHLKAGHRLEEGLHLAIRTALVSPRFLYRGHQAGTLDDWDLASRLAYFLTGAPPDDQLNAVAAAGKLSDRTQLAAEANRLIDSNEFRRFATNFTGQWLGWRSLEDITPDPRLIVWQNGHRNGMIGEAERFFTEILRTNRTIETFIKPDFTWGNERLLNEIYGQKVKIPNWGFARIEVPAGARFGGLLGQAGVLMATSNGSETQPVVRGVWVLRNILGDPPPPPPPGTPAIEPDTRGTKTVRQLLAAHTRDPKCASCHRTIDPIGMVLENYDPLGRWRTHYPEWTKDEKGQPVRRDGAIVDPHGEFPGGVQFKNIDDLRAYVLKNIDRARITCTSPVAGDGMLFTASWTAGGDHSAQRITMPKFDDFLVQHDMDKDGKFSASEIPTGPVKERFKHMDGNRDGFVDRTEWEAMAVIFERVENQAFAVKPDGKGSVSESSVQWRYKKGLPYVSSPLLYRGRLYMMKNGGMLTCLDPKTGEPLYREERIGALGDYYASPVAAAGRIYVTSHQGVVTVVKAGDKLEVLARNELGEVTQTSPVLLGDILIIRSAGRLQAFRETPSR